MATNLGLDLSGNSTSSGSSAATIGDNSYFVDNGINLDLSGAQVDTSTKIGLMGEDLHVIGNTISGITNNAFSAVLGLSAQNAENQKAAIAQVQGSTLPSLIKSNFTYILWAIVLLLGIFNRKKLSKLL